MIMMLLNYDRIINALDNRWGISYYKIESTYYITYTRPEDGFITEYCTVLQNLPLTEKGISTMSKIYKGIKQMADDGQHITMFKSGDLYTVTVTGQNGDIAKMLKPSLYDAIIDAIKASDPSLQNKNLTEEEIELLADDLEN